jgi:tRNA-dihydrouridine synthase C
MEGVTDAPMRTLQGEMGAFTFAVSEFQRVSDSVLPEKVFLREVPELRSGAVTPSGLPVQVQILGGDGERMARSALTAIRAGATAIDINFGCPAPTVNRHDGGASLLQHPSRLRDIVAAVREAVPDTVPVSAKIRLGWDNVEDVSVNAAMIAEAGAAWLTIHARTRTQGYKPPVFWHKIAEVRRSTCMPVVANGDIFTLDDFDRCREITGCEHFMIGRGALVNPRLPRQIARRLGIDRPTNLPLDWRSLFSRLVALMGRDLDDPHGLGLMRLKQWMKLAANLGDFPFFHELKTTTTTAECLSRLDGLLSAIPAPR